MFAENPVMKTGEQPLSKTLFLQGIEKGNESRPGQDSRTKLGEGKKDQRTR